MRTRRWIMQTQDLSYQCCAEWTILMWNKLMLCTGIKGGTKCLEDSEDDKRHSKVIKAMPDFFTTALKEIYLDHSRYISLEVLQQDLWRYSWRLPTTHDASTCGSKTDYNNYIETETHILLKLLPLKLRYILFWKVLLITPLITTI